MEMKGNVNTLTHQKSRIFSLSVNAAKLLYFSPLILCLYASFCLALIDFEHLGQYFTLFAFDASGFPHTAQCLSITNVDLLPLLKIPA